MDGWNLNKCEEVLDIMSDIYDAAYEIRNCIRGCRTGAYTYPELSSKIQSLADRLKMAAENLAYEEEDEEYED